MAQQPAQDTLIRLLFLLQKIPRSPRKTDVRKLASFLEDAGFKVDIRTVQRDLKKLSEIKELPLENDGNKPQGWSWSQEAKIWDMPAMNPQLALTFSLIDHYLKDKIPVSVMDFLNPYISKAEEVINSNQETGYSKWLNKVRVIPHSIKQESPAIDKYVLKTVYESMLGEHQFKASYTRRGETEPKEYVINPRGLVFQDNLVYLVATLWNYEDIKHLALHRFVDAEMTTEPVTRLKSFNVDTYLEKADFNYSENAKIIKLKIKMEADFAQYLVECPLSKDQVVRTMKDGSVQITANVKDSVQLRMWVKKYGTNLEVLAPKSLREEIKMELQEALAKYS